MWCFLYINNYYKGKIHLPIFWIIDIKQLVFTLKKKERKIFDHWGEKE